MQSETRVLALTRRTRSNLRYHLGADLDVAWPLWKQNRSNDFSNLYATQRRFERVRRFFRR